MRSCAAMMVLHGFWTSPPWHTITFNQLPVERFFVAWHMCFCFDQSFVNHIFSSMKTNCNCFPELIFLCAFHIGFPPFFHAVLAILALWKAAAPNNGNQLLELYLQWQRQRCTFKVPRWESMTDDRQKPGGLKKVRKKLQKDHLFWEWVRVMS